MFTNNMNDVKFITLPLQVYLRTAPQVSTISLNEFNSGESLFRVKGSPGFMGMEDLMKHLSPLRAHPTRSLPTVDHLIVEVEDCCLPWKVFAANYVRVTDYNGILPINYQSFAVAFTIPPVTYDCDICCDTFIEIFESPCQHNICGDCWKKILLNFYNHPVTKIMPYLHCPFENCKCTLKSKYFKKLLNKDEYSQLRDHIKKMREPDVLSVECPGCSNICTAPRQENYNRMHISIACPTCTTTTCYHCSAFEHDCLCMRMPRWLLQVSPGHVNRMYRHNIHKRNKDLTVEGCVTEIAKMLRNASEPLIMECPDCSAKIVKSTECNEISHCSWKWCYLCGEMTLPCETFLCDHFSDRMCPRYESTIFWNEAGAAGYRCQENVCYCDGRECTEDTHAEGRKEKNVVHRLMWLRNYMRNTPMRLRGEILKMLLDNGFEAFVVPIMCMTNNL